MNIEDKQQILAWIEESVGPRADMLRRLQERIEILENQVEEIERQVDNKVGENHYHDDYASAEYVERNTNSVYQQLNRLRDELANTDYRIADVQRAAERAQSAAEQAQRNSGRGYY